MIDRIIKATEMIQRSGLPRVKQSILHRQGNAGGLPLPNFLFYYWASDIRALSSWVKDHDNLFSWVTLEKLSVNWCSLLSLLCARLLALQLHHNRHCMFPPSLMDKAFNIWTKLGVTSMNALFMDNIFCSFGQLGTKFKIPQSHFF